MEPLQNAPNMLDLFTAPAFRVENGVVSYANQLAQQHFITQGTSIYEMISTGKEEYDALKNGSLYLTLTISGHTCNATASKTTDGDIFILDSPTETAELKALALAATELRTSLTGMYLELSRILPSISGEPDATANINYRINQMSRIIGNMSSAVDYQTPHAMEYRNITAILDEVFQHAAALTEEAGKTLRFQNLNEQVFCYLNEEMVERAAYNLISNALKFTPQGGWIEAKLTRSKNNVCLTVSDSGSGIPASILPTIFTRYLREPGIQDGNFGIGLGIAIVRSVAIAHGGTVLVEQPEEGGPRITVSFSLAEPKEAVLRSPIEVDYAGGRSHSLIELSDALPAKVYKMD